MGWYSVRCVFTLGDGMFEERITLWQAGSPDEAIALAEAEATEYAHGVGRFLGLAQSFEMFDEPRPGAEVYSLIRTSDLNEDEYLTAFFDTGSEHQRRS
jgi:hypothetical protein